MILASYFKAKPIRKKATIRKKKSAIDLNEEVKQNIFIEFKLNSRLKNLFNKEDKRSDNENTA